MRQNEGRTTKHNHTPSTKAGQLSRHSCNQIPRGRYQQTKVQAGPEHQTRQPAGEGKQRGQRKEPQQKRANNKGSNRAHPSTARGAIKPGRQRGAPTGAQKQHDPTSPGGQLMQGTTRPPKRRRAAQTMFVQSIVRLTTVRQEANRRENMEKGRAQNKKEGNKEMNYRSTSALSRLRTDTQVQRKLSPNTIHLGG